MGHLGGPGAGRRAQAMAAERLGADLGAPQKLLFSEKIRGSEGNHMKFVAADESRADARDLYVPMPKGAMAIDRFRRPMCGGCWWRK